MNRHDVVTLPAKVLRRSSKSVEITDEVKRLIKNMQDVTLDWGDHRPNEVGVALAAVQIGALQRVIVVRKDFKKNVREFTAYLNPEIIKLSGKIEEAPEGCLSIKDIYGLVPRYSEVRVKALTGEGKQVEFTARDFLARVFQHEIDHTNGRLFIDHLHDQQLFRLDDDGKFIALTDKQAQKYRDKAHK